MKLTNRTLTTLLRGMVSKSLRDCDTKFANTEFGYNQAPSYVTSQFLLRYAMSLIFSLPLILFPFLTN